MKRIATIFLIVLLTIVLLVGVVFWGVQTPAGQEFLTGQVNRYLRKKLQTKVGVAHVRFHFPEWIRLEGVYVEDLKGDTLLAGRELYASLDMWGLLKGKIALGEVRLEGVRAKVLRTSPDTTFNYQFIVDAFSSGAPSDTSESTPLAMSWDSLSVKALRLQYRDDVSGIDTEVSLPGGRVQFAAFNPSYGRYHPVAIRLEKPAVSLRMYRGTQQQVQPEPAPQPAAPGDTLDLKLGEVLADDLRLDFSDEESGLKNGVRIARLQGRFEQLFLAGQLVNLKELKVDGLDTFVEFEKRKAAPEANKAATTPEAGPGWKVIAGRVILEESRVRYDDFNAPAQPGGMDFAHLNVNNLAAEINGLTYAGEGITGTVGNLAFTEKSGFQLQQLRTNFAYTEKEAFLKELLLKTPHTTLGNEVRLRYTTTGQLTDDPGKVGIDLNLQNSRVGFADILTLVPDLAATPPFDKNPNGYISGNAKLTGTVGDLQIRNAVFTMPQETRMAVTGSIKGLPDTEKMQLALNVTELAASRSDLLSLLPANTVPESIALPEQMAVEGEIKGSLDAMTVDARLRTTLGNASLSGDFHNITDSLKATYNGRLSLQEFDMGKLLKQPPATLGKLSLDAGFSGEGLTPDGMNATLDGNVLSADVNGYVYRNLKLEGAINKGEAELKGTIKDPNATLALEGKADLNGKYPVVKARITIDTLDLKALKLYSDSIGVKGTIAADFSSTDPENPLGTIQGENIALNHAGKPVPVGPVALALRNENGVKEAELKADFAGARLTGNFSYPQLGAILLGEIHKYFAVADTVVPAVTTPYDIRIDARVAQHEAIRAFAPALTRLDTVRLSGALTNRGDTTLKLTLSSPMLIYDTTRVSNVNFDITGDGTKAVYKGEVAEVNTGSFRVRNIETSGDVRENRALLNFVVRDSLGKEQHAFVSRLKKEGADYRLNLQNRLLLNYRPWRTDSTGYIQYGPEGVLVNNFSLRRNRSDEKIVINSVGERGEGAPYPNGPIRIVADSVAIGPLVTLVTRDTLADGRLDGDIFLKNYMGDAPVFFGNLRILNMTVTQIPLGDFSLKATNDAPGRIRLAMDLQGENNDVSLKGNYLTSGGKPFDFDLDLRRLEAKTVEAFSFGELRNAQGRLSGKTTIKGDPENPLLDGELRFDGVSFNVKQLGARYAIENGRIGLENEKLRFRKFALVDSLNQRLEINGSVSLTNIPDVTYDLKISTDKFMVLNASRKDNELAYGKAFARANIGVKGRGAETIIDGSVKILKGSNVTLVLPDDAGAVSRGDGVVEFVDRNRTNAAPADTAARNEGMVVDFASELSLNIETDKEAEFTVVIDELNGDNLRVKGNAQLNTGLAPNGQLYLLGLYELEEGAYELSFEILRKQFDIRKGSKLIWSGDPMKAELDITAVYEVQADPSAFSPSNYKYGKVPFNVLLNITGNLSSPKVEFGLEVSEKADRSIKDKIDKELILKPFESDPAEMNKQVFALLLMNKFMSETSNVSFGGFNAEAIARQSVSKLLSDQLNNLASDLVKGVQLDFNLNSTTGTTGARTDLNVGLTKGFMNDRITVSVGRNFELENSSGAPQSSEIFDNIAVNYKVTRDGRYLVRAYRKNQFQTVLEGFIVETGVSFIVTLDYDLVKEFFQK